MISKFFMIDPKQTHDLGDGILDLDVHCVKDCRAWRHSLHCAEETEPDLSPLVTLIGIICDICHFFDTGTIFS